MTCIFVYLQVSVSTSTKTVVKTNKRKMHESDPIILTWSEILENSLIHSCYTSSFCRTVYIKCIITTISLPTYLWLNNVLRMRNIVLGMVDATLRYAVKPAWSSVLFSLSEMFALASRNLYIQYLKGEKKRVF